jgi:hypothetical protein
MPRTLTAAATTAVTSSHVPLCVFVEMVFPSGTLRFTNAGHSIAWDGETWLGAGNLARVEPITEVASAQAAALNVQFSGIDPAYVSAILDDHYQGNPARIWIATLSAEMEVLDDPVLVFQGRMDEPYVTIGETAEVQLALENRFADWDRPRLRMYTDADQKSRHPGDRFFEYIASMESTSINWGTYRGPVAPDPLKQFNRTIDKAARYIPGAKQLVVDPLRRIGDSIAKVFGF